jgi:hypothetical protein
MLGSDAEEGKNVKGLWKDLSIFDRPVLLARDNESWAERLGMETMMSRRNVIKSGAMAAMAGALPSSITFADPMPGGKQT